MLNLYFEPFTLAKIQQCVFMSDCVNVNEQCNVGFVIEALIFSWQGFNKFQECSVLGPHIMHLLTKWEDRAGKYLARGQGIQTKRSEARTSWPRAKYFPVRPDLTQSISILSYDHLLFWKSLTLDHLLFWKFWKSCLNPYIRSDDRARTEQLHKSFYNKICH